MTKKEKQTMTKEEKELLLKDISARLPYRPKARKDGWETDINPSTLDSFYYGDEIILPYLRPLTSMTKEEKEEYKYFVTEFEYDDYWYPGKYADYVGVGAFDEYIDWLNEHHFDYRGLIERGLAIEAPEGMYNT